uniref:Uncharacterized protein n=1 Tax=Oryza nivara TaxID=4536 RepID=A0A0E0I9S2_ORYNI
MAPTMQRPCALISLLCVLLPSQVMYLQCGGVVLSLATHHTNCRRCPNRVVLRGDLGEKL